MQQINTNFYFHSCLNKCFHDEAVNIPTDTSSHGICHFTVNKEHMRKKNTFVWRCDN